MTKKLSYMQIPNQFTFVKWLKEDSVALTEDKFGKRFVIKPNAYAKYLFEFSKLVKSQTRTLQSIMPQIFQSGEFIYHEYITGQLAGGTTGLFGFSTKALDLIESQVLAIAFHELHTLSSAAVFILPKPLVPVAGMSKKRFVLEERQSSWYIKNLEETREAVGHHLGPDFYFKIQNFLSGRARTVDSLTKFLVNGDLHPENIMINCLIAGQARSFLLSDWDVLHFNNPAYDLADLYVWSWRKNSWREEIVRQYRALYQGNQEELAVCLKFCQLYLAAQMINHVNLMLGTNLNPEATENAQGLMESSKELLKKLIK